MKYTMPLHQFGFLDSSVFAFTDRRFSIIPFKVPENLHEVGIYSKWDCITINNIRHALLAEIDVVEDSQIKEDANLILISFRLLSTHLSPYVRYTIHTDIEESSRCLTFFTFPNHDSRLCETYNIKKLQTVDATYEALKASDKTSARIRNALSFLFCAFVSDHWLNAFVFLMSAIEALLSNDKPGSATDVVCRRVTALLKDPTVTRAVMAQLYHVRSRILHGNIDPLRSAQDNLQQLELLERIACSCFKKLLEDNSLVHFASSKTRELFLKELDNPSQTTELGCKNQQTVFLPAPR